MDIELILNKEVQELMTNPSAEKRNEITNKISNYFSNDIFNEAERKIAVEVIRLLAKDSEVKVRKTLAHNLKFTKNIPSDIILDLANDIEEVSTPILEFSSVLTQENLIEIVKSCEHLAKLIAIARRNDISEQLSDTLVDTDKEEVVESLMNNSEAKISIETLNKTIEKFAKSGVIMEAMVSKAHVPYVIIEKIMTLVSDEIKKKLTEKYKIRENVAKQALDKTQEDNVLDFLITNNDKAQKKDLVDYLFSNDKLTHSILLRALCKGDIYFFVIGLAKLSNMEYSEVEQIIFKEGVTSFSALYKKANMPKGSFDAVNIILRFILQEAIDGVVQNMNGLADRLIIKIIEGGYDTKVNMMKYFMLLIKSKVDSLDQINDNDSDINMASNE